MQHPSFPLLAVGLLFGCVEIEEAPQPGDLVCGGQNVQLDVQLLGLTPTGVSSLFTGLEGDAPAGGVRIATSDGNSYAALVDIAGAAALEVVLEDAVTAATRPLPLPANTSAQEIGAQAPDATAVLLASNLANAYRVDVFEHGTGLLLPLVPERPGFALDMTVGPSTLAVTHFSADFTDPATTFFDPVSGERTGSVAYADGAEPRRSALPEFLPFSFGFPLPLHAISFEPSSGENTVSFGSVPVLDAYYDTDLLPFPLAGDTRTIFPFAGPDDLVFRDLENAFGIRLYTGCERHRELHAGPGLLDLRRRAELRLPELSARAE